MNDEWHERRHTEGIVVVEGEEAMGSNWCGGEPYIQDAEAVTPADLQERREANSYSAGWIRNIMEA